MKRSQILLTILAGLLVVVLFVFFLLLPQRERVQELELEVEAEQTQQQVLLIEIERLRDVRERAAEVEVDLAVAEAIVPTVAALPAALRQLQTAADEAGIVLRSVTTGRPEALVDAPEGLSRLSLDAQVAGSYFQIIDFLRRLEDPAIAPRAMTWEAATVARGDDYPSLDVSLSGSLYATLMGPPQAEPEPEPAADVDDDAADELEEDAS